MVTRIQGGNGDDNLYEEFTLWSVLGTFDGHADGGNGTDRVTTRLGDYILVDPALPLVVIGFDVVPGGQADHRMTGGNGHDALSVGHVGRTGGRLNVLADGGNGDDDVFAQFDVNAESTGRFGADVRGGNGEDHMDVRVRFFETQAVEFPDIPGFVFDGLAGYTATPAPLDVLSVRADGGNGFDTCLHSPLVSVIKVEDGLSV
jgi:hypothetical protein